MPASHATSTRGGAGDDAPPDTRVAANSVRVAGWTLISRATGFVRVATVAAVLGPTFLGNTFLSTNLVPNLVFEFLTGSLLVSMLVPSLARRLSGGDRREAEVLGGRFLGLAIAGFGVITVALLVAAPLVLQALTAGVVDTATAIEQRRVGHLLLVLLAPQVMLYGIAGVCGAVMNAHGRFALPAAAPAVENIVVVATVLASAVVFGTGAALDDVQRSQLLLLGVGTTSAVGLHAATLWLGARRAGIRLRPRLGWGDDEVRRILGLAVPSLGYAGLNALRVFLVLIVANRLAGGVVAFQLALAFYYLPVAVCARPVAVALLPELSRLLHAGERLRAGQELHRAALLALFLTMPAAVAFAVLAEPLAAAAAFGEMTSSSGVTLVAASLAALSVGVLGEGAFVLATHASYARGDARAPFVAMAVRTGVSVAGMLVALVVPLGTSVLVVLGLAISLGNLVSAWSLGSRVRRGIPFAGQRTLPAVVRIVVSSAVMVIPAYAVAVTAPEVVGPTLGPVLGMGLAVAVGAGTYLVVQHVWGAPELRALRGLRTTQDVAM